MHHIHRDNYGILGVCVCVCVCVYLYLPSTLLATVIYLVYITVQSEATYPGKVSCRNCIVWTLLKHFVQEDNMVLFTCHDDRQLGFLSIS